MAAAGAHVVVPARRPDTARAVLQDVEGCEVIAMDLADLGSVRAAAVQIGDRLDRLDILMAVAGVMATPERRVGPGWESQLAANHFGHFALTSELYPLLAAADGARVVVNSSAGHTLTDIRRHDPHFRYGCDNWLAYGQAKTANPLFAVHLDTLGREDGVRAFDLHPGKIITGLQREMSLQEQRDRGWVDEHGNAIGADFKTPSQGAATGLWAATSPLLDGLGGLYLEDCDIAPVSLPEQPMGRRRSPRVRHRPRRRRPPLGMVPRGDGHRPDHPLTVCLRRLRDGSRRGPADSLCTTHGLAGGSPPSGAGPPKTARIARLIQQLDDSTGPSYDARAELIGIGSDAIPAIPAIIDGLPSLGGFGQLTAIEVFEEVADPRCGGLERAGRRPLGPDRTRRP